LKIAVLNTEDTRCGDVWHWEICTVRQPVLVLIT